MESIVPSRIYTLFPDIGFNDIASYPRIHKWLSSLNFISRNPIFGWGAAAFPVLYFLKSGEWFGHAHNLPLELAVSYGVLLKDAQNVAKEVIEALLEEMETDNWNNFETN